MSFENFDEAALIGAVSEVEEKERNGVCINIFVINSILQSHRYLLDLMNLLEDGWNDVLSNALDEFEARRRPRIVRDGEFQWVEGLKIKLMFLDQITILEVLKDKKIRLIKKGNQEIMPSQAEAVNALEEQNGGFLYKLLDLFLIYFFFRDHYS